MVQGLSFEQRRFLADLVDWDERRRPVEILLGSVALALGGLLIIGTAVVAIRDLRDATVLAVLVPGFAAGLLLIGVYVGTRARIRDRQIMAALARRIRAAP